MVEFKITDHASFNTSFATAPSIADHLSLENDAFLNSASQCRGLESRLSSTFDVHVSGAAGSPLLTFFQHDGNNGDEFDEDVSRI